MKRTVVICGFPGVGKSHLFRNPGNYTFLDSDSFSFSWLYPEDGSDRMRHPQWPRNYIEHIESNLGEVDAIFVSTHKEVRIALQKSNIEFILVYPGLEMESEYIQRYINRGNQDAFIGLLRNFYQTWVSDLMKQESCIHMPLGPGEYLNDVFDRILNR